MLSSMRNINMVIIKCVHGRMSTTTPHRLGGIKNASISLQNSFGERLQTTLHSHLSNHSAAAAACDGNNILAKKLLRISDQA